MNGASLQLDPIFVQKYMRNNDVLHALLHMFGSIITIETFENLLVDLILKNIFTQEEETLNVWIKPWGEDGLVFIQDATTLRNKVIQRLASRFSSPLLSIRLASLECFVLQRKCFVYVFQEHAFKRVFAVTQPEGPSNPLGLLIFIIQHGLLIFPRKSESRKRKYTIWSEELVACLNDLICELPDVSAKEIAIQFQARVVCPYTLKQIQSKVYTLWKKQNSRSTLHSSPKRSKKKKYVEEILDTPS